MNKLRQILSELVSGRGTARRVLEGAAAQPSLTRQHPSVSRFASATSPRQARRGLREAQPSNPVSPDLIRGKAGHLWTNQNRAKGSMIRRLVTVLALAALAVPASAQETGTLLGYSAAQVDVRGKNSARQTMQQFGACLVQRQRGRAERFAALPTDSDEYLSLNKRLYQTMGDDCLSSGDLGFSSEIFRGSVFDALYAANFRAGGPVDLTSITTSNYAALYKSPLSPASVQVLALENFGECVARSDPANTRALVLARPDTDIESNAFAALSPRFNGCIVKGEVIKFSKTILRSALSEGLYRLSMAALAAKGTVAR